MTRKESQTYITLHAKFQKRTFEIAKVLHDADRGKYQFYNKADSTELAYIEGNSVLIPIGMFGETEYVYMPISFLSMTDEEIIEVVKAEAKQREIEIVQREAERLAEMKRKTEDIERAEYERLKAKFEKP